MENTIDYHPLEQPDEIAVREKEDAMGAYLMMFAAMGAGLPLPIINLIAAVIYYYVNKSKSRFVQFHSYQALISTLPTALINIGFTYWTVHIIFWDSWHVTDSYKGYVAAAVIANLGYFVIGIIAAIKARKGMYYYYIFFGKIAYQKVFRIKENASLSEVPVNQPPRI
jgi:uncharacterized membrane protein